MILLHSHLVYGKDARPKGSYFNLEKAIYNNHQVQVSNNKTSLPHVTNIFSQNVYLVSSKRQGVTLF